MKLIMLDVDGVLNNAHTQEEIEGYTFVEDGKIQLLKQIIDATGARVVLTSTWRAGWADLKYADDLPPSEKRDIRLFCALRRKLQEYDIKLLSYTDDFGLRGLEIEQWLKGWHGEPIDSFVILDDLDAWELQPYADRLVQTAFSVGLTEQHVQRAIELLNKHNASSELKPSYYGKGCPSSGAGCTMCNYYLTCFPDADDPDLKNHYGDGRDFWRPTIREETCLACKHRGREVRYRPWESKAYCNKTKRIGRDMRGVRCLHFETSAELMEKYRALQYEKEQERNKAYEATIKEFDGAMRAWQEKLHQGSG